MKHKTAELEGELLDAAVAKANGMPWIWRHSRFDEAKRYCAHDSLYDMPYCPSTEWRLGGEIIEREKLAVYEQHGVWVAGYGINAEEGVYYSPETGGDPASIEFDGATGSGFTPLVAAMRAFVTSRLGEEVEL